MDITKRQITKIAREVSKFTVRTLRDTGIGTGELDVLHTIRKNPGITQASVCRILGIDKGLAARQTASLEGKGYITRQENPEDGRSQLLFAAPQAETLKNSKAQIEAAFYEGLDEEQQSEFARLLCILYERCKQESKAEFPHMTERIQKEE